MMLLKRFSVSLLALLLSLVLLCSCTVGGLGLGQTPSPDPAPDNDIVTPSPEDDKVDPTPSVPQEPENPAITSPSFDISRIPAFDGSCGYVALDDNVPSFTKNQITTVSYEYYAELDTYGRCGLTVACIGKDLMPTGNRGSIGSVYPTGWQSYKDENGKTHNFYERSHLIGWQLTGEDANRKNLISGTFLLNDVMQSFENMVADYIKETNHHVMYRVTPIFVGSELLARGVIMEAYSVEDDGDGISFRIFIYNAQKDYVINYATGEFSLDDSADINNCTYVVNKNSGVFHNPDCSSVIAMKESNKVYTDKTRDELVAEGKKPCGKCKP